MNLIGWLADDDHGGNDGEVNRRSNERSTRWVQCVEILY